MAPKFLTYEAQPFIRLDDLLTISKYQDDYIFFRYRTDSKSEWWFNGNMKERDLMYNHLKSILNTTNINKADIEGLDKLTTQDLFLED